MDRSGIQAEPMLDLATQRHALIALGAAALIVVLLFREAVGARIWFAACLMLAAGLLVGYAPQAGFGLSPHALAVALMLVATWLTLTEQRGHTHAHVHAPLAHSHAHLPDLHHRHPH